MVKLKRVLFESFEGFSLYNLKFNIINKIGGKNINIRVKIMFNLLFFL